MTLSPCRTYISSIARHFTRTSPRISLRARCVGAAITLVSIAVAPMGARAQQPPLTKIAENGAALLPVVVAADSPAPVKAMATTLAGYLSRIAGGTFRVEESSSPLTEQTKGIVVALASQVPGQGGQFKAAGPTAREDYLLKSRPGGFLLAGNSELAVSHAVWDFLYRLGYRQFFPGEKWEVVPQSKNLSLALDDFQHPDYYARRIWFGYGSLPENRAPYADWMARNRVASGIPLDTGHAYDSIIAANIAEFEKHPEYLTKPGGNKFSVSNEGLRQLVVNFALKQFEKNPALASISMDPSDGGGWESATSPDAKVFKSVSDRVVTLANAVATAVNEKYPGKYVGIYAYNEHSPPPTIKVHPNVVASVATAFITGGYSVDQLMDGWAKQGAGLGVREYYGVALWDHDLPGQARVSNTKYLQTTIPKFHAKGTRFISAESSDSWGCSGLGYYMASRMLWDVDEAKRPEAIRADFLDKAFGSARDPMGKFYELIDGANRPLVSDDLLGRMYRQLDAALKQTNDARVRARIMDLALYTRYVELFCAYTQSRGEERQAAFEAVLRFGWRIRGTQMIHTWGLWRSLKRDDNITVPPDASYRVPEPKNPWKSSQPYSEAEILQWMAHGIANYKLLDFTPASFSAELVPATPLKLSSPVDGGFKRLRGSNSLSSWVEKAPGAIQLQVRQGVIFQNRGPANLTVYAGADTLGEPLTERQVPPDRELHDVRLETTFAGLHNVEVRDKSGGCEVFWPKGVPTVVESSFASPARMLGGRWTMVFYVPTGTKVVGGFANAQGSVFDSDGKPRYTFTGQGSNYWSVPVLPGQDGKVWSLRTMNGNVMLMTVPPYLARNAAELMVPAELVKP